MQCSYLESKTSMDYNILKKIIDRKTAIIWMDHDQNDEFWLDPILWADIVAKSDEYIERTKINSSIMIAWYQSQTKSRRLTGC